jgi:hypothetical protein
VAPACRTQVQAIDGPFADDFERAEVGPTWNNTGADYGIRRGKLAIKGAYNHPLWLRRRLPRDVTVELEVSSNSPQGDLKIELFGDGESFDPDRGQYNPTGYIFVFGGWGNSLSIIGRLGEHDAEVKARRDEPRVEPGRAYRWTITRRGGALDWLVDGQPFLSWTDPEPLVGSKHEYLGFNNWETDVTYDNLRIRPVN